jgi:drug/metabolite transporter (DMT)-like permease
MSEAPQPRHLRAELALAVIAFIWGATFIVVKEALQDVSTLLFLALRFTLATAILAFVLRNRLRRRKAPEEKSWFWIGGVTCGALLFLGYALQTAGLRLTTASKSAFITGLYIVLVPLAGSLVYWRRPRLVELGGAAAATLGTALMTSGNMELRLNFGDILTIFCAVAFAGHILAVTHFSRRMDFERLSLFQVGGVALFSWVGVLIGGDSHIRWTGHVWFAILTTAVFATALSFLLYTWAQGHTTATRAALIFALEPVFAGMTGWIVAGEPWTGRSLLGAGLILSGIVLVEMKPPAAVSHQEG